MNDADIESEVKRVERLAKRGDFEQAHAAEDELLVRVLEAIADGCSDPQLFAALALETKKIQFQRHCS